MSAAAGLEDLADHVEGHFPPVVLEDREHNAELFRRKGMLLADQPLGYDEERLALRQIDAGLCGDDGGVARDGIGRSPSLPVPVGGLELRLFVVGDEIAAFLLQLREERIVDLRIDEQIAISGAT